VAVPGVAAALAALAAEVASPGVAAAGGE
jgi:hypothetical protein